METELPPWTAAEKIIAGLGLALMVGVGVILLDVVTGGRLLRRMGCGCDGADTEADSVSAIA